MQSGPPTLRALLRESWREITSLDSRAWRTLRGLARPGWLARLWTEGERDRVFPPIRLYLLASALYFLVGGDPYLAWLIRQELILMIPDTAVVGLSGDAVRGSVESRMMRWTAVVRLLGLIPITLALAAVVPPARARVAPAAVLCMHFFTVSFLLTLVAVAAWTGWVWLAPNPGEVSPPAAFPWAERGVSTLWLVLGVRRLYGVSLLRASATGVALAALDLFLLLATFGFGAGAMDALLEG